MREEDKKWMSPSSFYEQKITTNRLCVATIIDPFVFLVTMLRGVRYHAACGRVLLPVELLEEVGTVQKRCATYSLNSNSHHHHVCVCGFQHGSSHEGVVSVVGRQMAKDAGRDM